MIALSPQQTASLKDWFQPERPGPLIGPHVIHSGHGACHADRWPASRSLLVECAGNYSILGDPNSLRPGDLKDCVQGFVEAGDAFLPALQADFPDLREWPRVIYTQQEPGESRDVPGITLRRLTVSDSHALREMDPQNAWITKTWGGAESLSASGYGWGAFDGGRLVSVACTFFMGQIYEDIGVVTEPAFRGRGLSTACAGGLCADIHARGRLPSWSTSPDNHASLGVARKLGFTLVRNDRLIVIGMDIPHA